MAEGSVDDSSGSPSRGEVEALEGYVWQFDHIAWAVYPQLQGGVLTEVRLADPELGRVDDCALVSEAKIQAYQFKKPTKHKVTLSSLTSPQRTSSGAPRESLFRDLVATWRHLTRKEVGRDVEVRLVLGSAPSEQRVIATGGVPAKISFRTLSRSVLDVIALDRTTLAEIRSAWPEVVGQLESATELADKELERFLKCLRIETSSFVPSGAKEGATRDEIVEDADVRRLSDSFLRHVADSKRRKETSVRLSVSDVLELTGWGNRTSLRHSHKFPVQVDLYEPLEGGVQLLDEAIAAAASGYVALLGPPGSGKSTLLAQSLTGLDDRVIRYLAFVPTDVGSRRGRTTASDFVHDLVVSLDAAGLGKSRSLPPDSLADLRVRFSEQLLAAGEEFEATGRRTIVVVDGLDHVQRENKSADTLLDELPPPANLPDGVVLLIGSQTLEPLNPEARRQALDEAWRRVDLREHQLASAAIASICVRAELGATPDQIQEIGRLTGGHPLSFAYLLNAIASRSDRSAGAIDRVLAETPVYDGDIAQQYASYWGEIEADSEAIEVMALVARLRPPVDMDWMATSCNPDACRRVRRRFRHLFRGPSATRWRFFHDSFRQFVLEQTSLDDDGEQSTEVDRAHHRQLAHLAQLSPTTDGAWREIYHLSAIGDWKEIVRSSSLLDFRTQYGLGRSPDAIAADVRTVLQAACTEGDGPALVRGLLASEELDHRNARLAEIDVLGVLIDAGLVDLAATYLDSVAGSLAPTKLWRALDATARLHDLGRIEGRLVFDSIEPFDLLAHRTDGTKDDVLRAWARAATRFRPSGSILAAAQRLFAQADAVATPSREEDLRQHTDPVHEPFAAAVEICRVAAENLEPSLAEPFLRVLIDATSWRRADGEPDETDSDDESLRWNQFRSLAREAAASVLFGQIDETLHDDIQRAEILGLRLSDVVLGERASLETILRLGELAVAFARGSASSHEHWRDVGRRARNALELPSTVSTRHFGFSSDESPEWITRVRELHVSVTIQESGGTASFPEAIALLRRPAAVDSDEPDTDVSEAQIDATRLALRIDQLLSRVATTRAWSSAGLPVPPIEITETLNQLMMCYPEVDAGWHSPSRELAATQGEVTRLVAETICQSSPASIGTLIERLHAMLGSRPATWPAQAQQTLGMALKRCGTDPTWLPQAVAACDEGALAADADARLDSIEHQARVHAELGETRESQQLARQMLPDSFGLFHRKDNQLLWLTEVLATCDDVDIGACAAELAPILVANVEVTDGSAHDACLALTELLTRVDPGAGLRLALWLYATTGACHFSGVIGSFVSGAMKFAAQYPDPATGRLLGSIIAEFVIPFTTTPDAGISDAVLACEGTSLHGPLCEAIQRGATTSALPSSRNHWLRLAGDTHAVPNARADYSTPSDYNDLVLPGERIARSEVDDRIRTLDDFRSIRLNELPESRYPWVELVGRFASSIANIDVLSTAVEGAHDEDACLLRLSSAALNLGDRELAIRLAERSLEVSSDDEWSWMSGTDQLKAHQQLVRLDRVKEDTRRRAAAQGLFRYLTSSSWAPTRMTSQLSELANLVDGRLDTSAMWSEIATYLQGLSGKRQTPEIPVLQAEVRSSWSSSVNGVSSETATSASQPLEPADSLDRILVAFVMLCGNQPEVSLRDSAATILTEELVVGNAAATQLVSELLNQAKPDPVVLSGLTIPAPDGVSHGHHLVSSVAKSAVAAADELARHPGTLERQEQLLQLAARSPSVVGRHLAHARGAAAQGVRRSSLPSKYRIELPANAFAQSAARGGLDIGDPEGVFGPFARTLRSAAECAGLDDEQLLSRAWIQTQRLADEWSETERLRSVAPSDNYITALGLAMRTTVDEILDDLDRADLLPVGFASELADPHLLLLRPCSRPVQLKRGPSGSDLRRQTWIDSTDDRVELLRSSHQVDGEWLIGARADERPIQDGFWAEEITVDSWTSEPEPKDGVARPPQMLENPLSRRRQLIADAFRSDPKSGGPPGGTYLLVNNDGLFLGDQRAEWTSIRPDIATACGWQPDLATLTWRTPDGEVVIRTVYWSDGHLFHEYDYHHDTPGRGWAVIATERGMKDLETKLGGIRTLLTVRRTAGSGSEKLTGFETEWIHR